MFETILPSYRKGHASQNSLKTQKKKTWFSRYLPTLMFPLAPQRFFFFVVLTYFAYKIDLFIKAETCRKFFQNQYFNLAFFWENGGSIFNWNSSLGKLSPCSCFLLVCVQFIRVTLSNVLSKETKFTCHTRRHMPCSAEG